MRAERAANKNKTRAQQEQNKNKTGTIQKHNSNTIEYFSQTKPTLTRLSHTFPVAM